MYPNLIVDNFFEDPDSIVDLSTNIQYFLINQQYYQGLQKNYQQLNLDTLSEC